MNRLLRFQKTIIGAGLFLVIIGLISLYQNSAVSGDPEINSWQDALALAANAASVDYFLKIGGIAGDAEDPRRAHAIIVDSFSWGANQAGIHRSSEAQPAQFSGIKTVIRLDAAAPELMVAAAKKDIFKEVKIEVIKADKAGQKEPFFTIKLENAFITSFSAGGTSGSEPTESLSFNFEKIKMEFKKKDGTAVQGGWDVAKNQEF